MPDLDGGSPWREVLVIAALPVGVAFVLLWFYLEESPIFLAKKERHNEAINSFNNIARKND